MKMQPLDHYSLLESDHANQQETIGLLRDLLREAKQWIFKIANSKGKLLVHRDEIAEVRDLIARIEKELE